MEKNLCIPILMVAAFVAIIAALFAGPLTDDEGLVIDAHVDEDLQFRCACNEEIIITSDEGLEVRQIADTRLVDDRNVFNYVVTISVLKGGFNRVHIFNETGKLLFTMGVRAVSATIISQDGPRDISPEMRVVFEQHGSLELIEDDPAVCSEGWWGNYVKEVNQAVRMSAPLNPNLPTMYTEVPVEEGWAYQVYEINVKFSENTFYNYLPHSSLFHMKACPDVYAVDVLLYGADGIIIVDRDPEVLQLGPGPHQFYIAFLVPEGTEHGLMEEDGEPEVLEPQPNR